MYLSSGPMTSIPLPYRLAVGAVRIAAPVLARSSSKLGRGMEGRRDAHGALVRWAATERDVRRPLVWFHAPSVGEGLQAQAVMRALRATRPEMQVVFTYFSPSAEPLGARFGADVAGYLPWDTRTLMTPVLDALRPDLIVFTKTEVWPVLVEEARARGVPVAIVAASVPPRAGRLSRPARALLRGTWATLSAGLACAPDDARGLAELGVPREIIQVMGDPGIDAAVERAEAARPDAPYLAPFRQAVGAGRPSPTVVLGSTWPSDEAVFLPALEAVRARVPDVRVVLAPHEPGGDRVGGLLGTFMERGWHPGTLAHMEIDGVIGDVNAVVVERVGVLSDLYTIATVACVGGGFHDAGLHSVLEPAAAGVPVLFGPRHHNARSAGELVELGGAEVAVDAAAAAEALIRWLTDRAARAYAAKRARDYIQDHRGAAARTARRLDLLMKTPDSR